MKYLRMTLAATLFTVATTAQAHYLWIEHAGNNTLLRFGEFAENTRERSPGRLDEIPNPQAKIVGASLASVTLQKKSDGFYFPAQVNGAELIAEEKSVGVRDWSAAGIGLVKPMFYARAATSAGATKPVLMLDIVPVGDDQYQLWFQNKPLANSVVTIYAPNGWMQEYKTSAEGRVTLYKPWRGQYVIEAIVLEKIAGEFEGKKFDAIRHRATLSLQQTTGADTFVSRAGR